ncbi:MAG: Fido protein [Patescibacteria group bacterium]|nr:Fido protein [Patescibacteria group bacterium]
MYKPEYTISNNLLNSIVSIESSRSIIQSAALLPLYERQFRGDAVARRVHFSTAIEGNYLNLDQIKDIMLQNNPNQLNFSQPSQSMHYPAKRKDVDEVINYRDLVNYIESIDQKHKMGTKEFALDLETIVRMHEILLKNIEDEKSGHIRTQNALTINYATGEKLYLYEPAENVKAKLNELLIWYQSNGKGIHPIIKAGLLHLEFVRIHPFHEGNGRLARGLATLSLAIDDYDINHFFCLDEYYSANAEDYYSSLQKGFKSPIDWLEYFAVGMSIEFSRIKDRVVKISKDAKVKDRVGQQFISERQEKIIEWINNYGYFKNNDFEIIFNDLSEDTVLRELKGLVEMGVIIKKGKTKLARYEFI